MCAVDINKKLLHNLADHLEFKKTRLATVYGTLSSELCRNGVTADLQPLSDEIQAYLQPDLGDDDIVLFCSTSEVQDDIDTLSNDALENTFALDVQEDQILIVLSPLFVVILACCLDYSFFNKDILLILYKNCNSMDF